MGRLREFTDDETTSPSASSLSESLIFTTISVVGLPVEVHIKDGSIYSGIFHTASFDKGYGIILKKARMVRKGTHKANVSYGVLIDTLVISPGDLVQVVAKGVMLPANGVSSGATDCDEGAVSGTVDFFQGSENGSVSTGDCRNQQRQVDAHMPEKEEDGHHHQFGGSKKVLEVNDSSTSSNGSYSKLNVLKENREVISSNQLANGSLSSDDASLNVKLVKQLHDKEFARTESVASEVSGSAKTEPDAPRISLPVPAEMAPQNPLANRTNKESKLNPGAKVFSPSFPNFRTTPPLVPTVPGVAYVPNSIPGAQVAAPQPEVGIRPTTPHSSWPVKLVPYVTSTATNADHSLQYNQTIAGHIATRTQPIRHGAHYQTIQAVPPYVQPNPQDGMFGRPAQVVYVHPVTHDVIQGPATLSQAPHPLLTSHPIHVAKHEGALAGQGLQVSVTPPLMANTPQPFAMPNHIQLAQPLFTSVRPVPILGSNIPYTAKFP